ncbi:MAG: helix-turn-helix domain-containing protein [Nitrososphaeraceae archaeon]|jgi:predicted transcriptional regulator|nr:helix-turn-helix domain-containing protein [Nitrososphaeraceae archaeon]MDW0135277.1 helix-turn-helix domain-containing protein [Nitrososphaeraceae archaeon]MDW0156254.1 helix-turn-helix domain-containing protein [Nitrososphaeraceae archaeon]RPI81729.1 MAG: helix-turn-helix domain-containing protein [Nitrosopumilales archaeon]HET6717960.1 helix-turn-helix domain-containing protein [Nitrososphaeraceae archaeon]
MLLPSEIESKLLIPAIRAILSKELVIEKGLKEEEVARMLGITQAAVSNYLRGTRGDNELISKLMSLSEIMSMIKEISNDLSTNRAYTAKTLSKFIGLCNYMRYSLIICDAHHSLERNIDEKVCEQCKITLTGTQQ